MTTFKRFSFSDPTQTMIVSDANQFQWIAFDQNNQGNCILKKVSAHDISQVYFEIEKSVTKIIAGDIDSSNIYIVYNDSSLIGEILSLNNPLTSTTEISIPLGVTQTPIDIKVDGTDLYILLPGNTSGTNAKILKFNTSGTFQETIDLNKSSSTVINASSFDIDSNGDIWVVTNNSPAEYIRVFQLSGGGYDFTIHEIT